MSDFNDYFIIHDNCLDRKKKIFKKKKLGEQSGKKILKLYLQTLGSREYPNRNCRIHRKE